MEKKIFEVLVCPVCKGKLKFDKKNNELLCHFDHLAYPIQDDIPILLEAQARKISMDAQ